MNNIQSLTDGPISPRLIQLAFPILCANILQCLSGTMSAFWVGRYLGEVALSAVANAQSMMMLLTGTAFGITMAATILVGQCMGGRKVEAAKRVIGTATIFFLALSVTLTTLGLIFAESLLVAMRTAPEALPLAVVYTRVVLLALPSMYLLAFVMSLLIGIGDSVTPLKFIIFSVTLAAILTPAFVFGGSVLFGGGVVGAALAGFVAHALCLIALLRYLHGQRHPLFPTRRDAAMFRVDWSIVGELVRKGMPMGAQVLVMSLSSVLMISLVNRFGVSTTAAYSALIQLWAYIQMPAIAISAAVSTMAAQSVGANNWVQIKHIARVGIGYSVAVTGVIVAIIYAADGDAYRLFLPAGSEALQIASHVNWIVTWSLVFMAVPLVMFGIVRSAGSVVVPLLIHIFSLLIVRYPFAAVLLEWWQADAIWWSFTISYGVDVALALLYYRRGSWHRVQRLQVTGTGLATSVSEARES